MDIIYLYILCPYCYLLMGSLTLREFIIFLLFLNCATVSILAIICVHIYDYFRRTSSSCSSIGLKCMALPKTCVNVFRLSYRKTWQYLSVLLPSETRWNILSIGFEKKKKKSGNLIKAALLYFSFRILVRLYLKIFFSIFDNYFTLPFSHILAWPSLVYFCEVLIY